jgi:hypothetical protein
MQMTREKWILTGVVIVIVCLGLAYTWGASGRFALQRTLDDTRQQLDLAEARGLILDARVSLYNLNFGEASRALEEAKAPLRRARQRYQDARRPDPALSIESAVRHVEEAQRLSGKFDPAANNRAGEALEAIRVATSQ